MTFPLRFLIHSAPGQLSQGQNLRLLSFPPDLRRDAADGLRRAAFQQNLTGHMQVALALPAGWIVNAHSKISLCRRPQPLFYGFHGRQQVA